MHASEAATPASLQEGGYGNASLMDGLPKRGTRFESENVTKVSAADECSAVFLQKSSFMRSNAFFGVHPRFRRELALSNTKWRMRTKKIPAE